MKRKRLVDLISSISYMQTSLALFGLSLVITVYLLIRAVISNGALGLRDGLIGIMALVFTIIGFWVPLYGHYIVKEKAGTDYRLGLILNGGLMLLLFFFFFLGM